ncbi:MAG TPA: GerMN domain-containing protein, partial [Longimicrobiales bacterium]|nr:GerMN domain-containing protein [Longimicrobiales bacterium]
FSCDEEPASTWRPLADGTTDTLRFALEALLEGPISAEQAVGLHSFFSAETGGMLNDVSVRDGVAYIDFQDFSGIIPNASTSAGSRQLLDQIAGTVFQFDAIAEAELSFDRSCDAFWNWLQRGCERLTRSGS